MARILITGAGGPAGLALARQLTDHEVIGVDMADLHRTPAAELFHETHRCPAADDPALVLVLTALVRRRRVDLVIPTVQDELPIMAASASLLGAPVVTSPTQGVMLAHDKLFTMAALGRAGVPIPRTLPADDLPARRSVRYPLVLKPRVSRGGRGVVVVENRRDLVALHARGLGPGSILQEFAPGTEYAVQVYRQPAAAWECVVLEKARLKQGTVGNAAAVHRCPPGAELDVASVALSAVEALDLRGPVDLDVRRLATGQPVVLEVNARFGAQSERAPELLERVLARHLTRRRSEVA
ncbi:ATP-grasp domain-containing protein [Ammonicoccus fulvus]|uniref:ATP-grasp domain-containing protein n=1 Tax=Ammonicoccus fulvus TaxID=3138240 RepID=A0ABZ3FVE5_9ACTN